MSDSQITATRRLSSSDHIVASVTGGQSLGATMGLSFTIVESRG